MLFHSLWVLFAFFSFWFQKQHHYKLFWKLKKDVFSFKIYTCFHWLKCKLVEKTVLGCNLSILLIWWNIHHILTGKFLERYCNYKTFAVYLFVASWIMSDFSHFKQLCMNSELCFNVWLIENCLEIWLLMGLWLGMHSKNCLTGSKNTPCGVVNIEVGWNMLLSSRSCEFNPSIK